MVPISKLKLNDRHLISLTLRLLLYKISASRSYFEDCVKTVTTRAYLVWHLAHDKYWANILSTDVISSASQKNFVIVYKLCVSSGQGDSAPVQFSFAAELFPSPAQAARHQQADFDHISSSETLKTL